ncbi:cytochrome P450 2J6-like [Branchiostoma floridae]|uniref:Cytochrome P450 2J6-like n=1 Tax=Branchiostoma floridae TaxID=7739 RepID=A0A9J7KKF7_BRAFL|nr:cytochrome P450 2J6-like [Branchiostoma floridae]
MATAVFGSITESVQEILQISGATFQSFLVFSIALTFLIAFILLKRPRNLPPYPAGRVPVLGHLLALGRKPYLKLTAWRRQYGDVFTVRMGMEDVVVLNGYTAVKDALVDRSELFASRPPNYMFDSTVGFGKDIVTGRWGSLFKQRRRFVVRTLKNLGMKVGPGSIEENIRNEASCVQDRIADYEGKPFDIFHYVTVAVANVICSMTFGKRYDYEDEKFREVSQASATVLAEIGAGQLISIFPFLRFVPGVNRACLNVSEHLPKIHKFVKEEIDRHRGNLDRENPRDFLDFCLLELEQRGKVDGLTKENVLYMAQDLFMAGTETSANTLRWSLLYLTLNPDIQKKAQEELDAVVGDSLPALPHRSRLPYVNACLMETMRIRTPGPIPLHATTQEVNVREYTIPEGTRVS